MLTPLNFAKSSNDLIKFLLKLLLPLPFTPFKVIKKPFLDGFNFLKMDLIIFNIK